MVNYSLVGIGVVIQLISLFLIGGTIGVLFGLMVIIAGVFTGG